MVIGGAGSTPYIIVERSPKAQKVFNKLGASLSRLQKKLKGTGNEIVVDWRRKELSIKTSAGHEDNITHLYSIELDPSLTWSDEGVALSGFPERFWRQL